MKRNSIAWFGFMILEILLLASCKEKAPEIEWEKSYGGSLIDNMRCIQETFDGGFIACGITGSFDGDAIENHGFTDFWILKLDQQGNIQWSKTFGGSYFDEADKILQTRDHGYLVAGFTYSIDGDVMNHHGGADWWILKLDSLGNMQWQQTIGTRFQDFCSFIQMAQDGGYIACGGMGLNRDSLKGPLRNQDAVVLKLDSSGKIEWQKSFHGRQFAHATAVAQTRDGGFAVLYYAGSTFGGLTLNPNEELDIFLIKLDLAGNEEWRKSFGGKGLELAGTLIISRDNGFLITGTSSSVEDNLQCNHGLTDMLVITTDSTGNVQWQKCYGGILDEIAGAVIQTADDGYVVSGYTESVGSEVSMNHGLSDIWIFKVNMNGVLQWQKSLGGSGTEICSAIQKTDDGGIIIAGRTDSNDGDITGNHGNMDGWIVKLKPVK